MLRDLGRREEALAAMEEAIDLYRQLSEEESAEYPRQPNRPIRPIRRLESQRHGR